MEAIFDGRFGSIIFSGGATVCLIFLLFFLGTDVLNVFHRDNIINELD